MTLSEAGERLLIAWERWDIQCLRRGSRATDAVYPEAPVTNRMEEACAAVAAEAGIPTSLLREGMGRETAAGYGRRETLERLLDTRP